MVGKSVGIKVKYAFAEITRKWLMKHYVIDSSLEFSREEEYLIIPVVLSIDDAQSLILLSPTKIDCQIKKFSFEEKDSPPKNLYDAVSDQIPSHLQEFIPKAFDTIGDIIIIDIPKEILIFQDAIGRALLSLFPAINTVYRKASAVSGVLRIRELEFLAGEKKCETVHHEHGIKIHVDVCNTYFSPRLGNEHNRVAKTVQKEDIIIDLFAGVGSFPLHIAKHNKSTIYAIDINKTAIQCLEKSIEINKLKGKIITINGDCKDFVTSLPKADRVIMNLPSKSIEYLDVACNVIKPGGIIYFYSFVSDDNPENEVLSAFEKQLQKINWSISKIINFQKVRESAPHEIHASLEASIEPSLT